MVRGLAKFKEHFQGYSDRYVLIGGTACSLAMEEVGLAFRATRDLDIVLCVEALDSSFVTAFWEFVHAGRYNNQQKSTGKRLFYFLISVHSLKVPAFGCGSRFQVADCGVHYRLSERGEREMITLFGEESGGIQRRTPMFIPGFGGKADR